MNSCTAAESSAFLTKVSWKCLLNVAGVVEVYSLTYCHRDRLGATPGQRLSISFRGKMQASAAVHAALQVELAGAQATKQGLQVCHL